MERVELNTMIVSVALNTQMLDDLIVYKCLCCCRNYKKKFDENLEK